MYAALWRALPGPVAAKAAACLVLALVVVAVCFLWVFPAVSPHLPFSDNTVDPGAAAGPAAAASAPAAAASAASSSAPGAPR
ncbi:MAG TPA: hypothetical protein VES95_12980 [Dermatophilaceae bacterium]|nr:hypothetical protein [Dermatophilaceae bacterium]